MCGLISPIRDRPTQPPRCLAVLGWGLANRWYSDLGRGPLSLDRLSGLREVVTGEAARDMDRLLAELEQKAY